MAEISAIIYKKIKGFLDLLENNQIFIKKADVETVLRTVSTDYYLQPS